MTYEEAMIAVYSGKTIRDTEGGNVYKWDGKNIIHATSVDDTKWRPIGKSLLAFRYELLKEKVKRWPAKMKKRHTRFGLRVTTIYFTVDEFRRSGYPAQGFELATELTPIISEE